MVRLKAGTGCIFILIALIAGSVIGFAHRGLAAEEQPAVASVLNAAPAGDAATPLPSVGEAGGNAADLRPVGRAFQPAKDWQAGKPAPHDSAQNVKSTALGDDGGGTDCRQLAEQLQQQRSLIAKEAGQLRREIAALREDIGKPGIKEVFAGLGYIFGLAGAGMYASSRRRA